MTEGKRPGKRRGSKQGVWVCLAEVKPGPSDKSTNRRLVVIHIGGEGSDCYSYLSCRQWGPGTGSLG
jgi:hypothetical protein